MKKTRGRPRKFDTQEALGKALFVFWSNGFAGTSLDELAEAMSMRRPSIYNAFGDKESLYRASLEAFQQRLLSGLDTLDSQNDPQSILERFFARALDVYTAGDTPLGCFIFCTAPAEAIAHPDVRADMLAVTSRIDRTLKAFFDNTQKAGRMHRDVDPLVAAQVTQATLHSLALRSRAGQSRASLNRMARGAVALICR
jgi:AcrR family transcriptional regulator